MTDITHSPVSRLRFRLRPGSPEWNFVRDPIGVVSLFLILAVLVLVVFAPLFTDYVAQGLGQPNPSQKFLSPSSIHIFGTDELGRDIWARIVFGGRTSLSVAFAAVFFSVAIGVPLGVIAGYFGGWVDEVIMRVTDIFLAFPALLLAIFLTALTGGGLFNMALAISLGWWTWYARLARAQVLTIRQRPFVEAAQVIGVGHPTIIVRHVLPYVVGPVMIQATLDFGSAVLTASSLSFLGLGVAPPTPDWGQMVSTGRMFFPDRWWCAAFPAMMIFIVTVAFNLLGDSVRSAYTPRGRQ